MFWEVVTTFLRWTFVGAISVSLQNLPAAAAIADRVLLFDNSDDLGYQPVGLLGRGLHQWFHPLPLWAAEFQTRFSEPTDG